MILALAKVEDLGLEIDQALKSMRFRGKQWLNWISGQQQK